MSVVCIPHKQGIFVSSQGQNMTQGRFTRGPIQEVKYLRSGTKNCLDSVGILLQEDLRHQALNPAFISFKWRGRCCQELS